MFALIAILMHSKRKERERGDNFSQSPCSWVLNNLFHQDLRFRLQPALVLLQKCGGLVQGPSLQLLSALLCSSAKQVLGVWLKQVLAAM